MLRIKNILLVRVIALFLSISIALPGTAYPDARPDTLRVPVGTPEIRERQQDVQRQLFLEKYDLLRFLTQEETSEYLATVDEVVSIHTGRTMSRTRVQQLIEEGEVSTAERHDGTRVLVFASELKSSEASQVKAVGEIPLIEKIANELIEQGVYDPIPSSKMKLEELFEEIERTERALEGDVQTGLLAGSIDQIKATEMFRQGHVVFIPRSEETLCVISDIHGDLTSLNRILEEIDFVNNMRSKKPDIRLVILGDYINDGINNLGVLLRVMQLKRDYPKHVILLRGNHEVERDDSVKVDGFRKEEEKILSSEETMLKDLGYIKQHSYFIFELIAKYGLEDADKIYERFFEFFKQEFWSEKF